MTREFRSSGFSKLVFVPDNPVSGAECTYNLSHLFLLNQLFFFSLGAKRCIPTGRRSWGRTGLLKRQGVFDDVECLFYCNHGIEG